MQPRCSLRETAPPIMDDLPLSAVCAQEVRDMLMVYRLSPNPTIIPYHIGVLQTPDDDAVP